jgi:hypothetical protein
MVQCSMPNAQFSMHRTERILSSPVSEGPQVLEARLIVPSQLYHSLKNLLNYIVHSTRLDVNHCQLLQCIVFVLAAVRLQTGVRTRASISSLWD